MLQLSRALLLPALLLVPLALSLGCLVDQPLPDLGACAVYPDGTYEYGQIGIGTCLAGPADLRFADNDGQPVLLVSNANHLGTFTGGSLLAIPWDSVDLGTGRNIVSDLSPSAVDLPSFAGGFDLWDAGNASSSLGDLALVGTRESEDGRTRVWPDQVWMVDTSDAAHPALAPVAADGSSWVQVESDPTDVVVDPATGLAFAVNRTSHSVSVLDLTGDVVEVILPWPEQSVTEATLVDLDGSGSTGELSSLEVIDDSLVPDETWQLTWVDGTWRVWLPEAEGLVRWSTNGTGEYSQSNLGPELTPDDAAIAVGAITDPALLQLGSSAAMYFADPAVDEDGDGERDSGGSILVATSDKALADWTIQATPALSASTDDWDAIVDAPMVVIGPEDIAMFYGARDSVDSDVSLIGRATSSDGLIFTRLSDPIFTPTWPHELGGVDDPHTWYDGEIGLWRMVYSAWDGDRWTIGHATSPDLEEWVTDEQPVFALDDADLASPVVTYEPGIYRMWVGLNQGSGWVVAEATSPDGWAWELTGATLDLDSEVDGPPGVAVQAAVDRSFRLERESSGDLVGQLDGGATVVLDDYGLGFGVVAGFQQGTDAAGSWSAGGIALGSVDPDVGLAWYTLTEDGGVPSIGIGTVDGLGATTVSDSPVLQGGDDFDDRGAAAPVVVATDDGYVMLYAGLRRDTTAIVRATSSDGLSWTKDGAVLEPGEEWDSVQVRPGSLRVLDDGSWHLYYSGSDGETWRIGEATSTDQGKSWTRVEGSQGYTFTTGTPGEWDDSGVRDPVVQVDGDGTWHLWYAGFDGDAWRLGYASRDSEDASWVRKEDAYSGDKRAIMGLSDSLFHSGGVLRPVVLSPDQAAQLGGTGDDWVVWYSGQKDGVSRVGLATGRAPDALHRIFKRPTAGDTLDFVTERGDASQLAIPLDAEIEGLDVTALGIADLTVDSDRGFLYAVSKLRPYVFVIDIRDDTPLADGSADLNYLDVEAVIAARNASGADGFRQVVAVPGSDMLYAVNDAPDAVWLVDLSQLVDDAYGDILYDDVVGWINAPRGAQRDEGVSTQSSVGAGQLLLHPDGKRLFVSNFNANSIGLIDLSLGPYGTWTHEIELVGENPFAMALSPDQRYLVFGNYTGEVADSGAAESTLAVLDVDPDSPTYLEVLTWIANR